MATDIRLKDELPAITEQLVDTYTECSRMNHLGHEPLPNKETVADILADLMEVLYPGYGRRQSLHLGNIGYYVGSLVDALHDKLTQQIARALRHELCEEAPHIDCEKMAQPRAIEMLRRLPDLRKVLEQDVDAAYRGDPAARSHHEIIFSYPGLEAISVYRVAHELHSLKVPYIPRMMTEIAHAKTGIDIHPGATIGPGFFIDHGTGVVIGETADIGENVKIYQGVTLGALSFLKDERGRMMRGYKRHPTVKDNVTIYANAIVLGGDTTLGEGSTVGGSTFLTGSIPAGCTVVTSAPELKLRQNRAKPATPDEKSNP